MKKFKTVLFVIYAILIISLISCTTKYPDEQSKFVIERIESNSSQGTSLYLAKPINEMDLNMRSTWFVDSIGAFNTGDTLVFQLFKSY